jgi:DNA-directed RNA polymerase specialized sigma24 family protein
MNREIIASEVDPAIVAAAQKGDDQAHAAIYRHYADRLYTIIYRMVPRKAAAQDLLQEVFIEVLRHLQSFSADGPLSAWLRAIAVNKCLTYLRSPWHRGLLWLEDAPQTPMVDAPTIGGLLAGRELASALHELSPITRAVVWLHDVEGYTHGEIAKLLNRTPSFSKSQLARAHDRLRVLLADRDCTPAALELTRTCTPAPPSLPINS